MLERLTQKDFAEHVNSTFQVTTLGGERADMSLVEVKGKDDAFMESFSLLFKGLTPGVLSQDTHRVTHGVMGTFDLFLGPVMVPGRQDAVYYQAVFNRMKDKNN